MNYSGIFCVFPGARRSRPGQPEAGNGFRKSRFGIVKKQSRGKRKKA